MNDHRRRLFLTLSLLALAGPAAAAAPAAPAGPPRELKWEELVPKGWNPFRELDKKGGAGALDDSPEGMIAMREIWDRAPTVPELDNLQVKVAGYVVPIEMSGESVSEFLLVPYFGACIHMPPPPANQIIHVVMARPAKDLKAMHVVWASGKMSSRRFDSAMGVSGYRIEGASIEPYSPRKK
jgi:hypothetical protein